MERRKKELGAINKAMAILTISGVFGFLSCGKPKPVTDSEYGDKYFLKTGRIVYWRPSNVFDQYVPVKGADKISFEVLYHAIAKDKNQVYCEDVPQPQVDHATFRFHKGWLKDKDHVYKRERKKLVPIANPDIDPKSLERLQWDAHRNTNYWSRDKNNFYFKNETLPVDYATFDTLNAQFLKDKKTLYTHLVHWKFVPLADLADDFTAINPHTVYNRDTLYYVSEQIEGRLRTRHLPQSASIKSIQSHFVRVNETILFMGKPFNAHHYDAESFEFVAELGYGGLKLFTKDKNHVYLNEDILVGADPERFEFINFESEGKQMTSPFAKDKNQVFYENKPISGADPESVVYVGWQYARDNMAVYYQDQVLPLADAKTFRKSPDNSQQFQDKNRIWNAFGELVQQ